MAADSVVLDRHKLSNYCIASCKTWALAWLLWLMCCPRGFRTETMLQIRKRGGITDLVHEKKIQDLILQFRFIDMQHMDAAYG